MFINICSDIATMREQELTESHLEFLRKFSFTCSGSFSPLCAFLGGFAAQEIVKSITQKYTPLCQLMYYNVMELVPEISVKSEEEFNEQLPKIKVDLAKHRSDGLRICVGGEMMDKIQETKLFMVGAGAIGCELLKNYAMLGVGSQKENKSENKESGRIILTDPDVIEVSNLNRQFLFREKHLRKPKSSTAAAAAISMNPDLKNQIYARLDKVHEGTSNIFTDDFFRSLTVVTNALDNVEARRYIDGRCVTAKTPLLESGTLGPKGHVQVILPFKTESYSSQNDPEETTEIPHCTLKMFPEDILHCIEWALDKFGKLFTQQPQSFLKVIQNPEAIPVSSQEITCLKDAVNFLQKRPQTFDDCLKYARRKFQKLYVNDIRQLLYVYPLDSKTKEGNFFWSLPKRVPHELKFNPKDPLHGNFIAAVAALRASLFKLEIPETIRIEEERIKMCFISNEQDIADFTPSDRKAKAISQEVEKADLTEEQKQELEEEQKQVKEEEVSDEDLVISLIHDLTSLLSKFDSERQKPSPKQESKNLEEMEKLEEIEEMDKMDKMEEMEEMGMFPNESDKKNEEDKAAEAPVNIAEFIQFLEFEKDQDLNFHVDFIHAMANLRAWNYGIEELSWIDVKLKAGRIIPALATTTAAIAGLQTLEYLKLLKKLQLSHFRNTFLNLALPSCTLSEPGEVQSIQISDVRHFFNHNLGILN